MSMMPNAKARLSPAPDEDGTVYLVLDDFGALGRAYRETDADAGRETVIANLLSGQYERPLRIIAFNTAAGWARDVTAEIACEIRDRTRGCDEPTPKLEAFLDRASLTGSRSRANAQPRRGEWTWPVAGPIEASVEGGRHR
jgi:hypothetical protein